MMQPRVPAVALQEAVVSEESPSPAVQVVLPAAAAPPAVKRAQVVP
jgi:hypothetical protein